MYRTHFSGFVGEARAWGETNAQMQFIMTGCGYRKVDSHDLPRGLQA
jgi:hypothetical protein